MDKGILSLEKHLNEIMSAELEKDIPQIDCSTVIGCSEALLKMEPAEKYHYDDSIIMQTVKNVNRRRRTVKTAKIILVAALLAAVIAGCAFGYVSKDKIASYYQDHVEIIFDKSEKIKRVEDLTVTYVPEGLFISNQRNDKYLASLGYTDVNRQAVLAIFKSGIIDKQTVSSENYPNSIEQFEYKGKIFISYQTAENFFGIIWVYDGFQYEVTGTFPVDELLKIAEGVS